MKTREKCVKQCGRKRQYTKEEAEVKAITYSESLFTIFCHFYCQICGSYHVGKPNGDKGKRTFNRWLRGTVGVHLNNVKVVLYEAIPDGQTYTLNHEKVNILVTNPQDGQRAINILKDFLGVK